MRYQIKIAQVLDQSWTSWLGDVKMVTGQEQGGGQFTTLIVNADDPAQLFGILDHIRDLNIKLISVIPSED